MTQLGSAEAMRHVQAQNPNDRAATPDAELTATITQACQSHRRIRLTYRTGSRMLLEPWAVVVRHGRWYLLGRLADADADARRVLRLDRITDAETTDQPCTPPANLDPVREVEDHLADGWTYPVEIRIDAPIAKVVPCVPRTLGRLEASGEHRCTLHGSTDEPTWYAEQLAAIPAQFIVLASDEIQAAVRALAQRLAHAVGAGSADIQSTHRTGPRRPTAR
jgi:predicted DNA-binding transcriptional regulator YafY